jgi:hypothetical protein
MRRESGVPPNPGSAQRIIDLLVRFESQQLSYRLPVNVDISRTEPTPPFIGSAITLWYKSTSPLEKECAGSTKAFVRVGARPPRLCDGRESIRCCDRACVHAREYWTLPASGATWMLGQTSVVADIFKCDARNRAQHGSTRNNERSYRTEIRTINCAAVCGLLCSQV